jgi:molecular chaperone DnaK
MGGVCTKLIERNTTIPTKKSQVFSTAEDNQTAVDIRVLQGEREFAKDNKLLGQFRLDGIPPASRGVPQIEVTFDIDANGMVNVSAKDKASGKEQKITITSSGGLSEDDINRMVQEAKEHEAEDKKAKEAVEKKNQLDNLIIGVEKALKEHKDKLPADEVTKIEAAVETAKKAMIDHANDAAELEKATQELAQSSQKIGEIMQKQAAEEGAGQAGPSSEEGSSDKKDDEPIDAEINE